MVRPEVTDAQILLAELYDHVVPYQERTDVPFFVSSTRAEAGPTLEVGCGTGRVLIPIARAGVPVVGLDASPAALAVCRRKLGVEEPAVQRRADLVLGDMRSFELGRSFSSAIAPFRAFQHLETVEEQLECLTAIRRHLQPGAVFVLDLFNPDLARLAVDPAGEEEEPPFTLEDGTRVVRRVRVLDRDLARQIVSVRFTYALNGAGGSRDVMQEIRLRYLFRFEAEHLLARCGFDLEQVYSDYEQRPFGSSYPGELVLIARAR